MKISLCFFCKRLRIDAQGVSLLFDNLLEIVEMGLP